MTTLSACMRDQRMNIRCSRCRAFYPFSASRLQVLRLCPPPPLSCLPPPSLLLRGDGCLTFSAMCQHRNGPRHDIHAPAWCATPCITHHKRCRPPLSLPSCHSSLPFPFPQLAFAFAKISPFHPFSENTLSAPFLLFRKYSSEPYVVSEPLITIGSCSEFQPRRNRINFAVLRNGVAQHVHSLLNSSASHSISGQLE